MEKQQIGNIWSSDQVSKTDRYNPHLFILRGLRKAFLRLMQDDISMSDWCIRANFQPRVARGSGHGHLHVSWDNAVISAHVGSLRGFTEDHFYNSLLDEWKHHNVMKLADQRYENAQLFNKQKGKNYARQKRP